MKGIRGKTPNWLDKVINTPQPLRAADSKCWWRGLSFHALSFSLGKTLLFFPIALMLVDPKAPCRRKEMAEPQQLGTVESSWPPPHNKMGGSWKIRLGM